MKTWPKGTHVPRWLVQVAWIVTWFVGLTPIIQGESGNAHGDVHTKARYCGNMA